MVEDKRANSTELYDIAAKLEEVRKSIGHALSAFSGQACWGRRQFFRDAAMPELRYQIESFAQPCRLEAAKGCAEPWVAEEGP